MSSIGGPGGIGGPTRGGGPSAVDGPDGPDGPDGAAGAEGPAGAHGAQRTGTDPWLAVASDIAAGKLTPEQVVDRMVEQIATTEQLAGPERAELREMLADLVAHDPYLSSLLGRVG
jgi:hypothetical protein